MSSPLDISDKEIRDRCSSFLTAATDEAARLHHNFIGTEHLYNALSKIEGGMTQRLLHIANLDVRYDNSGLTLRTGWSRTAAETVAVDAAGKATPAVPAEWRSELAALERQLRNEFHATQVSVSPAGTREARASSSDADVMRRVKSLVDESERRQQNELALRMGEAIRDLNVQRQADLRKIDQNLGVLQDRTGVEVLRNRQKLDYILQRVSQQPQ